MSGRIKNFLTYAAPMAAALIVRIAIFSACVDSPFRLYHTLVGLDMRKFLAWGTGLLDGHCRFTAYRFLVALVSLAVDPANLALGVATVQMTLGVATTGLTVFIFRRLFRNRKFAILAGLLFAFYAPPLLYETQVLKETLYLFLTTLSLGAAISAVSRRASAKTAFACGTFAILPFLTRFSGILWFACVIGWMTAVALKRGRSFRKPVMATLGAAATLTAVFAYEASQGRFPTPFFTPNAGYILSVGAKPRLNDLSAPEQPSTSFEADKTSLAFYPARYLAKIPYIITGAEMPNNVNYYFARLKLAPLALAISPVALIPLGFAGLLLMTGLFQYRARAVPLLTLLFAFAAPMILFAPLARYKLVLAPVLCVSAAFLAERCSSDIRGKDWTRLSLIFGIVLVFYLYSAVFAPRPIIRDSDLKAYAVAALRQSVKLMQRGEFKKAEKMIRPLAYGNPENPYIQIEYASSQLGSGSPKLAYCILKEINLPDTHPLAPRRQFELGEACRMLGDIEQAMERYRNACKLGLNERRAKAAKHWLKKLGTGEK